MVRKIKQMIKDCLTREKLIENAYLDVIENHLISKDVDEFLDFLIEVNSEYRFNTKLTDLFMETMKRKAVSLKM